MISPKIRPSVSFVPIDQGSASNGTRKSTSKGQAPDRANQSLHSSTVPSVTGFTISARENFDQKNGYETEMRRHDLQTCVRTVGELCGEKFGAPGRVREKILHHISSGSVLCITTLS